MDPLFRRQAKDIVSLYPASDYLRTILGQIRRSNFLLFGPTEIQSSTVSTIIIPDNTNTADSGYTADSTEVTADAA